VVGKGTLVIPIRKKNVINEEVLYMFGVNSNVLFVEVFTNKGMGVFLNSL
jgi:hypothetical protein